MAVMVFNPDWLARGRNDDGLLNYGVRRRTTMSIRSLLTASLLISMPLWAQEQLPTDAAPDTPRTLEQASAQRERADQMRKAAEERFKNEEAACYQKILLNDCLADAKERRTRVIVDARKLEAPARDFERAAKRAEVEAKEAQRAAEQARRQADEPAEVEKYQADEAAKAAERERRIADKARKAAEGRQKRMEEEASRKAKAEARARKIAERAAKKAQEANKAAKDGAAAP
jgi:hypothetical protein